jgi:hypothetical protein
LLWLSLFNLEERRNYRISQNRRKVEKNEIY